jgi:hypothetical protein
MKPGDLIKRCGDCGKYLPKHFWMKYLPGTVDKVPCTECLSNYDAPHY